MYNVNMVSYEYDFIFNKKVFYFYLNRERSESMPKETFFNLPEDKRERVIDAAMGEFATRSYHQARVTAITDKAGIAQGSFYQYFDDKKDLFKHIMDLTVEKKLQYLNHEMLLNKEKYGFFQLLREIYSSGFRFARENPQLVAIGNKLLNDKDLQREIWGGYEDESSKFFQQILEVGLDKGELNSEIDISLISRILTAINYSLIDIIYKNGKIDLENEEGIMATIDKMIFFIENGIKRRD